MSAAELFALIQALLSAAPQLVTLYDQLKSGTPITSSQVSAVLAQYETVRAQLLADIGTSGN